MEWEHQTDKPLFPDVIWSRPENKNGSGKLLMIGGSEGAMAKLAGAFSKVTSSGIGTVHLLVPDNLQKVTKHIPEIEYAPSTPSGSFARNSLETIISLSSKVDAVYLAGDIGKNSETTLLLESFFDKYTGLLFISDSSIESFDLVSSNVLNRERTVVFLNFKQLQSIGKAIGLENAFTSYMGRDQLAKNLNELSKTIKALIVVESEQVWLATNERIVDSHTSQFSEPRAVVWGLQQPEKLFEALVSSCK